MNELITSKLSKEELYQLAVDAIKFCADGKYMNTEGEVIGLVFETADNNFIELSNDNKIYLLEVNKEFSERTLVSTESLQSLYILFESVLDHFAEYNESSKE